MYVLLYLFVFVEQTNMFFQCEKRLIGVLFLLLKPYIELAMFVSLVRSNLTHFAMSDYAEF